jgi:hypothetical protein
MARHAGRITAPAMIGVGAAFDFHSGNVKWAPAWIRAVGLEWAYRLAQNPRRMWRRNLGNVLFVLNLLGQAFQRAAPWSADSLHEARPGLDPAAVSSALGTGCRERASEKEPAATGGDRRAA